MINSQNTIRAALDCDTIAADAGVGGLLVELLGYKKRRHLVVTIQAPPAPESNRKPSLPLNVALVIDASGSMGAEDSFPGMISLPPEQSLDGYHRETGRVLFRLTNHQKTRPVSHLKCDPTRSLFRAS